MRIENPRSENQIIEDGLWPEGEYSFEVASAENAQSKSGNDMIVLNLNVYTNEGKCTAIKDYLLEAMALKLRRCVDACGLTEAYESGNIDAEDFVGKTGFVILKVESGNDNYAAKNVVKTYVFPKDGAKPALPKQVVAEELDDEVPF